MTRCVLRSWNGCKHSRKKLVDDEIPWQRSSHASSWSLLRADHKETWGFGKHNIHTHYPTDRNCEICQRTKITRAPCRRRKGEAVPPADKFWWLDNSRPQSPKRQLRVSKQSSIRNRGTGSSYSMDPGVSVQKQNFTRNPEKLAKVPGTGEETKTHLHWQFLGIRQGLWRSLLESLHVYTTPIGS